MYGKTGRKKKQKGVSSGGTAWTTGVAAFGSGQMEPTFEGLKLMQMPFMGFRFSEGATVGEHTMFADPA